MNNIMFSIILSTFALPAALIFLVVYIIVTDIKIAKKRKALKLAVQQCKEECGVALTMKLLDRCIQAKLPYESMIEVLDHARSLEQQNQK